MGTEGREEECAQAPGKCRLGGLRKNGKKGLELSATILPQFCSFLSPRGTTPLPARQRKAAGR